MRKRGHSGYFETPPGTCFIKTDIPYANGLHPVGGNPHPFIVITEGPDYVECVMAETLVCPGKDKRHLLMLQEDAVEIVNTHPPLDPPEKHSSYFRATQTYVVPKEELYKDGKLLICCDGGDVLDPGEVKAIREAAYLFGALKDAIYCDPYDFEVYETHMEEWLPAKDVPEEAENPIVACSEELRGVFETGHEAFRPDIEGRSAPECPEL